MTVDLMDSRGISGRARARSELMSLSCKSIFLADRTKERSVTVIQCL